LMSRAAGNCSLEPPHCLLPLLQIIPKQMAQVRW
jgi:hypothetical protein